MNPQTLDEWQSYVLSLNETDLFNVAVAAGSTKFMNTLLDEGYSADEITTIQKMFAIRFSELGIEPPSRAPGCVVDYRRLIQS